MVELPQRQLCTGEEHAACVRQADTIGAAVEQGQVQELFEARDRSEDGRVRSVQGRGCRLEAALGRHGGEAPEIVQFEALHCRKILQRSLKHSNFIRL